MNIVDKRFYTSTNSDLVVYINNIYKKTPNYTYVRLTLINKKNGIIYEIRKKYKLLHKNIKHWYIWWKNE
jgi:hypothetical protein